MPTITKQPESKKIPKLRFGGFSGEWNSGRMEDVAKINQGLQIPISERHTKKVENSYFYITNEFLKKNSQKKYFIKNPPKSVLCNEDDILMTRTGNTGHVVTNVSGAFHNNFFKIKYDKEKIDKNFLYHFLVLPKTNNFILRLAGSSTIPDLNHGDFYKIKINFPDLPEQQKIAKFLDSVDKWIENLRAQKQSFEEYKKGMMQKIFSQEVRFKKDEGKSFPEWKEEKLGKVLDYEQPTKYIVKNTEYSNEYKIPVLTAGKTFVLGYTNEKEGVFNFEKLPVIIFDDFTTAKKFVDFPFKVKSSAMKILKNKDNKISDIRFIFSVMQRIRFELGEEHKRFWISEYSKIKIPFPSLPEQQKISDFLTKLDTLIGSKQQQITQAENWKKGLMQGLFV